MEQVHYKNLKVSCSDKIVTLTIDRPEVMNAMNEACWNELSDFCTVVENDKDIRALIITGSGEKAFVAGADIKMLKQRTSISALQGVASKALSKLEALSIPTIAAVNGYAFGGGCELALACDIRIASTNASFSLPEVGIGILPGGGGTQRLAKCVGLGRAKDMILTGRRIKAEEALQYGLITQLVTIDKLLDTAHQTANLLLSKGPISIALAKKCIDASLSTDQNTGMMMELLSYSVLISSNDRMEGVDAFLEKRKPQFHGE